MAISSTGAQYLFVVCHEVGGIKQIADINQPVSTGSVATGTAVAVAAAKNIVPCVLELGGKSAAIVYPDADIDGLMESLRVGEFTSTLGRARP